MTENKPREFYVCELLTGEVLIFREPQSGRTKFVESSELEALRAENEELKALKDKAANIALALGVEHNQKNREIEKLQSQLAAAKAEVEKLRKRLSYYIHNHVTRDIKPFGQCPECDRYHKSQELTAEKTRSAKMINAIEWHHEVRGNTDNSCSEICSRLCTVLKEVKNVL